MLHKIAKLWQKIKLSKTSSQKHFVKKLVKGLKFGNVVKKLETLSKRFGKR